MIGMLFTVHGRAGGAAEHGDPPAVHQDEGCACLAQARAATRWTATVVTVPFRLRDEDAGRCFAMGADVSFISSSVVVAPMRVDVPRAGGSLQRGSADSPSIALDRGPPSPLDPSLHLSAPACLRPTRVRTEHDASETRQPPCGSHGRTPPIPIHGSPSSCRHLPCRWIGC